MTDLLEIDSCGTSQLNNLKYTYLMTHVQRHAELAGAEALGVTAEFLLKMKKNVDKISDISSSSQASEKTALLNDLDVRRDELFVYLLAQIRTSCKSPIAAHRTAAEFLFLLTKPYIGSQNLPNKQQSQQIVNLQKDLAEIQAAEYLQILRLSVVLEELLSVNAEYDKTTELRSESNAEKDLGSCKEMRVILDKEYHYLTKMAGAAALMVPSSEATKFVESINILIKETNAVYNQRMAQSRTPEVNGSEEESI